MASHHAGAFRCLMLFVVILMAVGVYAAGDEPFVEPISDAAVPPIDVDGDAYGGANFVEQLESTPERIAELRALFPDPGCAKVGQVRNVSVLPYYKQTGVGLSIRRCVNRHEFNLTMAQLTTGCMPSVTNATLLGLCRRIYPFSMSGDDMHRFRITSAALCGAPGDAAFTCAYGCSPSVSCESYYAPSMGDRVGAVLGAVNAGLLSFAEDTADNVESDRRTDAIISKLGVFVNSLWLLMLGNFLLSGLFFAYMPYWGKLWVALLAAVAFLIDGAWPQVLLAFFFLWVSIGTAVFSADERGAFALALATTVVPVVTSAFSSVYVNIGVLIGFVLAALLLSKSLFEHGSRAEVVIFGFFVLACANVYYTYDRVLRYEEAHNLVVAFIMYITRAAVPFTGVQSSRRTMFWQASFTEARHSARIVGKLVGVNYKRLYVGFYVGRYLFLGLPRMLLGYSVARRVQKADIFATLWIAFNAGFGDPFAPLSAIWRFFEGSKSRRFLAFELISTFFELPLFFFGLDVLAFEFAVWALSTIIGSNRRGASRVLAVTSGQIPLAAFAVAGSNPWLSVAEFVSVSGASGRFSTAKGSGVGILQRYQRRLYLLTVRHVIDLASTGADVTFGGVKLTWTKGEKDIIPISDTSVPDPIVRVDVTDVLGIDQCKAADFELMSPGDFDSIKGVLMVSNGRDGMMNWVADWHVTNGDLFAAVDVMHGDSGSALFAFTHMGDIKYLGAVSRASALQGGFNVIACVGVDMAGYGAGRPAYFNGSDGSASPELFDPTSTFDAIQVAEIRAYTDLFNRACDEANRLEADWLAAKAKSEASQKAFVEWRKASGASAGGGGPAPPKPTNVMTPSEFKKLKDQIEQMAASIHSQRGRMEAALDRIREMISKAADASRIMASLDDALGPDSSRRNAFSFNVERGHTPPAHFRRRQ